ncbi:MAG: hypothetical protein L0154_24075 [Chloroflexi bacterium]|nr:hypothetical protein [Chloroflexota bacterium]
MKQLLMFGLLLTVIMPVHAAQDGCSGDASINPTPISLATTGDYEELDVAVLHQELIQNLNATGSPEVVAELFNELDTSEMPLIHAQATVADITGDGQTDLLTSIGWSWGATFESYISLYGCEDSYELLAHDEFGDWGSGPTEIAYVHDINANGEREILMRYDTLDGQKSAETIRLLEWGGSGLSEVLYLGNTYGGYGEITLSNADDNPATLELVIGYFYDYAQEMAQGFVEYGALNRPVKIVYGWDGIAYTEQCTYFSDNPTHLFMALHSAEVFRHCGYFDSAEDLYQQIYSGTNLVGDGVFFEPLMPWGGSPYIVYPDDEMSDEEKFAFAADLEQAYLRAFAGYRLVQFYVQRGDFEDATNLVQWLTEEYPVGEHGYGYVAMAFALLDAINSGATADEACEIAASTFDAVSGSADDPGIDFQDPGEPFSPDFPGLFYLYAPRAFASNPDNLFEVPDNLDGMIPITLCLQ